MIVPRLWGGHEAQRTDAMFLRRNVYVIHQIDSTKAYVQYYYPFKTPAGMLTAKLAQPGLEDWLKAIRDETQKYETAPIVLSLSAKHFQAVLFDKQRPTREAKSVASLKSKTLLELWATIPTVDEVIMQRKRHVSRDGSADEGPSRRDLLRDNPNISQADLIGILGQDSWSTAAKNDVIAMLVADATNINELLTFAPDTEAEDNSQGELISAEEMELTESSYAATPQSSGTESSQTTSEYFPSATGALYRPHADEMWNSVQEEWSRQYPGEAPPDLTEGVQLANWAKHKAPLLLEARRWSENPFILPEQLTKQDIRACVEVQRHSYMLTKLKAIASTITDPAIKNDLLEWLTVIEQTEGTNKVRLQLRNEERWTQLRLFAAECITGPTAVPFVKRDYSTLCAYVLVLNELSPEVAQLAFAQGTNIIAPPSVHMFDAFQYVPAIRAAFAASNEAESWDPIRDYFERLRQSDPGWSATHY